MSDNYTSSYKSTIDSLQLSTPIRQMLKTASMNLDSVKSSMIPAEVLKVASMGLGSVKLPTMSPEMLKAASIGLGSAKLPTMSPEMLKATSIGLGSAKSSMMSPEMLKAASMSLSSVKLPTMSPEMLKVASMGVNPSLTKLLGTDQIIKLATTGLGNSMSPYIKKTLDINKIFDSTPSISEAIKLNVKAASAWNSISKTMDIESFAAIMSNNLSYNTFNPESMGYQRNDQTSNLKSDETIPEDKDWQPGQSTSDTDISSENLVDENIELMEYLNKMAIEMFDNGFSLPTVTSVLFSVVISFTNILVKTKDVIEAYAWLATAIVIIYKIVAKYL